MNDNIIKDSLREEIRNKIAKEQIRKTICHNCLNIKCEKLKLPNFAGVGKCIRYIDDTKGPEKRVWCADEIIQEFENRRK